MKLVLLRTMVAAMLLGCLAGQASAGIVYKLVDVELAVGSEYAGSLTGTFTTDEDRTTVLSADIHATGATIGAFTYDPIAYEFNPGEAVNLSDLSQKFLLLQYGAGVQRLQLNFASLLAATGTTALLGSSNEYQFTAGERTVVSGMVEAVSPAAVPEPSALATLFIGAPIALAFAQRCRRGTTRSR